MYQNVENFQIQSRKEKAFGALVIDTQTSPSA